MVSTILPNALRSAAERLAFSVFTAEQVNNSGASALAAPAESKPDFSNTTASWNYDAACRVSGQTIHDGRSFDRRKQPLRVDEIGRRFDNCLHRGRILRQCRSMIKRPIWREIPGLVLAHHPGMTAKARTAPTVISRDISACPRAGRRANRGAPCRRRCWRAGSRPWSRNHGVRQQTPRHRNSASRTARSWRR
jgi:hypothetical protein